MTPDPLFGRGYTAHRLHLGADEEGELIATLVHRIHRRGDREAAPGSPPLLVLHGWSDYVLDRALLDHLGEGGHDVWALDLRKYGRSLRDGQTPTAIDHLSRYDHEIGLALRIIGRGRSPVVIAHSMGGLIASLYAQRHPRAFAGLALNSPWLEMHGGRWTRLLGDPLVRAVAPRLQHRAILPTAAPHVARTTHRDYGGRYDYELALKPAEGHGFPASTLLAVLDGQRRLARSGPITLPVLVLHAARSRFGLRFSERMRRADGVLDVRAISAAARRLGPRVRVEPIEGARHEVFLSDADARSRAVRLLDAWFAESF
ncbi:alpha/beta hydrolase [Brachybacterium squillarum]|uniref:alpha/beta hydrolase n=1 Tax=Brachybacterium squillarum TaxID=661979 RepID=UPI0002629E1A|nr:alpha/beta hydrolase [Brachybacterium squillarum]